MKLLLVAAAGYVALAVGVGYLLHRHRDRDTSPFDRQGRR